MSLHGTLFGAAPVDAAFTDQAGLQALLDVEAALAEAQAALGIIPASAAGPIRAAARADIYDAAALATAALAAGNIVIPLVAALTARVTRESVDAARWVHWGATSQDILDTGLVLQLRNAGPAILALLDHAAAAAAGHARRHAATPMAGRTWLQHATPITFGLKAAGWCDLLSRVRDRLAEALERARVLQLGGAAGTLAAFGPRGLELQEALGARLGLAVPTLPWHAHRDRLADLAAALGVATGALGKIGRDLALLAQTEVGEAVEGAPAGGGGSSTMPQKQNPVGSAVALAVATRAPGLVATMLAALPQEHERGLGGWQAEWDTLPELVRLTGGAARAIAEALDSLEVDPDRMRRNLALGGGLSAAEAVAMALARHVGKEEAHRLVAEACRRAVAERRQVTELLAEEVSVVKHLTSAEIERLLDPAAYLGHAEALVARALNRSPGAWRGRPDA